MTEKEFFNACVWEHIVDHETVLSGISQPQAKRKTGGRRALFIMAACFLCTLITVACIPNARAEVLSWFGFHTTPGGYLGEDPQTREQLEPVESLITQADPSVDAIITNPGETGRISARLTELLNCSPQEALYDGDSVYVSLKLGGGFGVWLLEQYTGGSAASVAIPQDQLADFFDHDVPQAYLTGEQTYYSHTTGQLVFVLPDGSAISGSVQIANSEAYADLFAQTAREPQRADELTKAYLAEHDITAYAALKVEANKLLALSDASGNLKGNLSLLLQIELDGSKTAPPVTVLEADMGEVAVNVSTYRAFSKTAMPASDSAEWTGDAIITHYDDSEVGQNTYGYVSFTNRKLKLDGLKMKALGVEVDATGIKNLQVEVRFPEHWTQEEIRAFSGTYGIHFELLINGEKGDWMVNGVMRSLDTQDAHTRVWHCRAANLVPLALLQQIKELTLIPTLDYRTAYYALLPDQTGELVVRGDETQFQLDQPFRIWNDFTGGFDVQKVEFPQYAITFHIPGEDSVTHD